MTIKRETRCRICEGQLETVLDFGEIYLSGFVKEQSEAVKAPLALSRCKSCGLVQLRDTVELDVMYRQYWYSSSLNRSMVSSLQDIVRDVTSKVQLQPYDVVMDIGCNDGTLLGMYPDFVTTVGFDPALNLEKKAAINLFVNDYFSRNVYTYPRKAKVITAIAMFYDLPDPNKFVQDVKEILHEEGIFVIQFTDLLSMFAANAFDNICHEHLEYYRFEDVINLLASHNLQVIDVSYNEVNGGSIRVTAAHPDAYDVSPEVTAVLQHERLYFKENGFAKFKAAIARTKHEVSYFIGHTKDLNQTVYLLGASTKGNSLLQICGVEPKDILFAGEVNPDKFGLRTVGTDIEIVPEDDALAANPTYFFVPVWHFKKNLLENYKIRQYLARGGRLVFPLPSFHIVGSGVLHD